jgi:hemerythrin
VTSAITIKALVECDAITEALLKEHEEIEKWLQALSDGMAAGANQEILMCILTTVEDFCVVHFDSEEQGFRNRDYVKADAHANAHKQFLQRLHGARTAITGSQFAASDTSDLLNSFHNHVDFFDKPAYVWSLWQHFQAGDETPQHLSELCSLDRLGKITWTDFVG